jgi:hypothetical protein
MSDSADNRNVNVNADSTLNHPNLSISIPVC